MHINVFCGLSDHQNFQDYNVQLHHRSLLILLTNSALQLIACPYLYCIGLYYLKAVTLKKYNSRGFYLKSVERSHVLRKSRQITEMSYRRGAPLGYNTPEYNVLHYAGHTQSYLRKC